MPKRLLEAGYEFKYPGMHEAVEECITDKNPLIKQLRKALYIVAIPPLFGLLMRFLFGIDSWNSLLSVMSLSFIFLVPFGIGALTIYLSNARDVEKLGYRIFMPWVPILGLLCITIALTIEGWACWMMALPIFLIAATLGGLTAGYFKLRKNLLINIFIFF